MLPRRNPMQKRRRRKSEEKSATFHLSLFSNNSTSSPYFSHTLTPHPRSLFLSILLLLPSLALYAEALEFKRASRCEVRYAPHLPLLVHRLRLAVCRCLAPLFVLAVVAFPCAVFYRAFAPIVSRPHYVRWYPAPALLIPTVDEPKDAVDLDSEDARLEKVLKEAAMEDKTVILTTLNAAWSSPGSVIDLFFESFWLGDGTRKLLDHLVMIALDQKAYMRCMSIHFHCFALITEGVDFSEEKHFMSAGYLEMMWRRIKFLRVVLEKGYNFIFSDADIMWFRDPLPHFYLDGDFQIACDQYSGSATDLRNRPNGGFNYVKSNNRSIEFYKFWYSSREKHPGLHDQDVLNFIKYDPFLVEIGVRIRFLSTTYFGGICEPSRDFSKVCTMHANCCIGLARKIHDLRVMLDVWRNYMALPPNKKKSGLHSWRVPQNCSLAELHP